MRKLICISALIIIVLGSFAQNSGCISIKKPTNLDSRKPINTARYWGFQLGYQQAKYGLFELITSIPKLTLPTGTGIAAKFVYGPDGNIWGYGLQARSLLLIAARSKIPFSVNFIFFQISHVNTLTCHVGKILIEVNLL